MRILVDSSVWIEYLRNGTIDQLDQMIEEDLVVTNDIILTELIPSLTLQKRHEVIESFMSFECVPLDVDWDIIRSYQLMNLQNGINKVGIPDLLIMQQVIENNLALFTRDKHFKLMCNHFEFQLIEQ